FFFCGYVVILAIPSFPTRRSSDLVFGHRRSDRRPGFCGYSRRQLRGFQTRRGQRPPDLRGSGVVRGAGGARGRDRVGDRRGEVRSEEHTSELQSREKLVCRLLLEK